MNITSEKKRLVIFTGSGISVESGLHTFRNSDGLWEGYAVPEVASPGAWRKNPEVVLDFYNKRRREVAKAEPNAAHLGLVELEKDFDVHIITQNIDDLHERAGSTKIMHLHGEIFKMRSETDESLIYPIYEDMLLGQKAADGGTLRPDVVWFEEAVPMMEYAVPLVKSADIFVVIGTSLVVYPAAGLVNFISPEASRFIVDKVIPPECYIDDLTMIVHPATIGVKILQEKLAALK